MNNGVQTMSDGYLSKDRDHLARLQRQRRARMRRVDYMPSPQALAAIEAKRSQCRPGSVAATNSAVIDAIVAEWAELTGIKNQEVATPMTPAKSRGGTAASASAYDFGDRRPELMHASRARASAYDSVSRAGVFRPFRAYAYESGRRVVCGARRHRDGQPCQAKSEPGKRRCRFHGGRSTGPRTAEGKARALANLRLHARGAKLEPSESPGGCDG